MTPTYAFFGTVVTVCGITLFAYGLTAPEPVRRALHMDYAVSEWEHGFKTDRVVATRYTNPTMGYNIGFEYPKDEYNSDRAELDEFMTAHGGWVYQSGGFPGAGMYVKFKDVSNKDEANKKLKEILPSLSALVASL